MLNLRHLIPLAAGFAFVVLFVLASWKPDAAGAQVTPLTYPQIITALNTSLPNAAFQTKEQLIEFLIKDVRRRKVDRPLTDDREADLRQAGATDELIEAIRANSPSVKPTPKPLPTRTRTPTPSPTPESRPREFRNAIGMEFVLIPRGSFMMGNDRSPNEGPEHRVNINYEFYLGKFEVTQEQWQEVMGSPHAGMKGLDSAFFGDDLPVVRLSWNDARAFISRLNRLDTKYTYRLPSEAEWEYAERAGTQTRFYWGDDPDFGMLCKYANVKDYSRCPDGYRRTAPPKTYLPNEFGLYNMTGNVWEWCEDVWAPNYNNVPADGSPNLTYGDIGMRAQRGGSWADDPQKLSSAARGGDLPTDRNDEDGFRLVAIYK